MYIEYKFGLGAIPVMVSLYRYYVNYPNNVVIFIRMYVCTYIFILYELCFISYCTIRYIDVVNVENCICT